MRAAGFACHPCNGALIGAVGWLAVSLPPAKWVLQVPDTLSLPAPLLALLAAGTVAWFVAGIAIWELVLFAGIAAALAGWACGWAAEAWLGASAPAALYVQLGLTLVAGVGIPVREWLRERLARRD